MEEVDRINRRSQSTAVAAFIGYTERATEVRDGQKKSLLGRPPLVTNWSQYIQKFGGFIDGAYTPDSVYGYFANGGSICYVVSVKTLGTSDEPDMSIPAQAEVVSTEEKPTSVLKITAKEGGPVGNNIEVEVKTAAEAPEGEKAPAPSAFMLVVKVDGQARETFDNLSMGKSDRQVATVVNEQSQYINVEVVGKVSLVPASGSYGLAGGAIKEKRITLKDYQGSVAERRGLGGLEALDDVTMICVPDLMASFQADEIDIGRSGCPAGSHRLLRTARHCFAVLMRLPV
jgi:hypothetical protein